MSSVGPVAAGLPWIVPDWPAPGRVAAFSTVRVGGVSEREFGTEDGAPAGLNLGDHVGDDPNAVRTNRARLEAAVGSPIRWLRQVHGIAVHDADAPPMRAAQHTDRTDGSSFADMSSTTFVTSAAAGPSSVDEPPTADAAITGRGDVVLAVMTADCLPILFADTRGRMVGVAHAGWRGLAAGVAEATVDAMRARLGADAQFLAWLGPAIGPAAFEVGADVRDAFCDRDPGASAAFVADSQTGKWRADLYSLARQRLASRGVVDVGGGDRCTVTEARYFYSHRRDRRGGRMASLVRLLD
jgi:polyphenol oxidase